MKDLLYGLTIAGIVVFTLGSLLGIVGGLKYLLTSDVVALKSFGIGFIGIFVSAICIFLMELVENGQL